MAFSKDVLTVVGLCCVSKDFRNEFFKTPTKSAEGVVGRLRDDEKEQIERIAGYRTLPTGKERQVYQNELEEAFNKVSFTCDCPRPPCPDPF